MGWCSATDIFDDVTGFVLKSNEARASKVAVIKKLASALEAQDWDCQGDSDYFSNPIVQRVFKELHPTWEWSDEQISQNS